MGTDDYFIDHFAADTGPAERRLDNDDPQLGGVDFAERAAENPCRRSGAAYHHRFPDFHNCHIVKVIFILPRGSTGVNCWL